MCILLLQLQLDVSLNIFVAGGVEYRHVGEEGGDWGRLPGGGTRRVQQGTLHHMQHSVFSWLRERWEDKVITLGLHLATFYRSRTL